MAFARAVTCLALVCCASSAAVAQAPSDEARARALAERGFRDYDAGRYAEAIEAFEEAYRLSPVPGLLFNIARAYQHQGPEHCAAALEHYRRYLATDPDAANRASVEARIDEIEPCAEPRAPPAESHTQPAPVRSTSSPNAVAAPRPSAERASASSPILGWTSLAVGVVGLGVAAVAAILTLDRYAELDQGCAADDGCPSELGDTIEEYETLRLTTWIAGGVGIAGVALGLVLLLTASGTPAGEARAARGVEAWWTTETAGVRITY